jgi:hypothetical protein
MPANELDTKVKLAIYRITADSGMVPSSGEVAKVTELTEDEVRASFTPADEMVSIFASIGLTGPFWDPKSDQWN